MKYDVISVGSVAYDIFLKGTFIEIEGAEFPTGKGLCVPLGSKVNIENTYHRTGGSALNTAITFSRLGLRTALFGKIGVKDTSFIIQQRIEQEHIAPEFLREDSQQTTLTSILVHSQSGERTIFRGVPLDYSDISLEEIDAMLQQTAWVYISHIPQPGQRIFEYVMKTAPQKNVKIAFNPGSTQLDKGKELVPFLSGVNALFVNKEEASVLTGVRYEDEQGVFEKLDQWVEGIAVMTKGSDGLVVSDGEYRWECGVLPDPAEGFVDRTGAGDAFGSGFTTALIQGKSIEEAIQLGSANATGVITQWGANQGLLRNEREKEKYGVVEVKRIKI